MTSLDSIQSSFLEEVKKKLSPNLSFADELAEILNISRDSSYRRIRGETVLSLDEVKVICNHYGVSVDALVNQTSDIVSFHYKTFDSQNLTFDKWLKSVLANLEMLQSSEQKEMIYFAKDIPVFYYFDSPTLSAFKMFFWMRSVLRYEEYKSAKFKPELIPNELMALGKKIWERYTRIPRTEIWSDETLNVTLRQIEFYQECGFFADSSLGKKLCEEYSAITKQIREWAATGYTHEKNNEFKLYKNDLLIADNTILFKMGERRVTFIPFNTMNLLSTTQESFCKKTEEFLTNLISTSSQISTTGEKERNKFFNAMEEKISRVNQRLNS